MSDAGAQQPQSAPLRALVVSSDGAPAELVGPVIRAIEAAGLELRLVDLGRAGARRRSAIGRVLRAVVSEVAERRLLRELLVHPPEVAICFDPGSAQALSMARDTGKLLAAVVAIVPELAPREDWADTDADRYLTMDDSAAVELTDHGIDGTRILAVGPVASRRFAQAAREDRRALRQRFKIKTDFAVVCDVDGRGYEATQQLALQLAMAGRGMTTLFDAGTDRDAATALRRQVPTLEMRAKLFGKTPDAPLYWRCADIVIARPTLRAVSNALLVGARFISLAPEGEAQDRLADALEQRGIGATAKTPLLLSSALEAARAGAGNIRAYAGRDGAEIAALIAKVVGADRQGVLDETRSFQQERAEQEAEQSAASAFASDARAAAEQRVSSAAGGLEDLGGDDGPDDAGASAGVGVGDLARLRAELATKIERAKKRVFEARQEAESWDKRRMKAQAEGRDDLVQQAGKAADAQRKRMHGALQDVARLEKESARLEREAIDAAARAQRAQARKSRPDASARPPRSSGPSMDDLLGQMKRKSAGASAKTIEDELAALKEKMKNGGKR